MVQKVTIVLQVFSALVVDIFLDTPGAAAASSNITRCTLSAAAVAVLQPLVDAIGRAWFFTLIGLIDGVAGAFASVAASTLGIQMETKERFGFLGCCEKDTVNAAECANKLR